MTSGKTGFQSDPESIQDLHLQLIDSAMAVSRQSDDEDPYDDVIEKNYDVIDVVVRLLTLPDKSYEDQVFSIFLAYNWLLLSTSFDVHFYRFVFHTSNS